MYSYINESKNLLIIYVLMVASAIITIFVIPNFLPSQYKIINLLIWGIIFWRARKVSNQHNRFKSQREELKIIFILVFQKLIFPYFTFLTYIF